MWLLEKTIKHPQNDIKLRNALNSLNIDFIEVDKKPFIPLDIKEIKNTHFDFVYASTNTIKDLGENFPGVYFNLDNFNYKSWIKFYGDNVFNSPSESNISTIKFLNLSLLDDNKMYFIRPVDDLKSFSGTVVSKKELTIFINEVNNGKYSQLDEYTEIIIAPAYKIEKEWRCFIVDKKVATASLYKKHGSLCISNKDIPETMILFAEEMSKLWEPAKIFTLDIGLANNKYYIIEAQCSNSSGFYECDVLKLVQSIKNLSENK